MAKEKNEAKAPEAQEESKKEESAPAPAEVSAAPKEEEKKAEQKLEKFYPEFKIKDGTVFLKRRKGKPRFRKVTVKKSQAQLYAFDRGQWTQKSALPQKGPVRNLRWHLRQKWIKIEEKDIPKLAPRKPSAPKEAPPAEPAAS